MTGALDQRFRWDINDVVIQRQVLTEEDLKVAGGPGSGHFGHAGRPGEVGGSAPSEGPPPLSSDKVGIVRRRADEVAEKMGVDPSIIKVVDKDPREFEVGNQQFREAGHYNPNSREIEINARNGYTSQMSGTKGLVAHEISHAIYHAAEMQQAFEHTTIENLDPEDYQRLFQKNGYVRPETQAEVHAMFPASAFWYKHIGDSYMETEAEQGGYPHKGLVSSRYVRNIDALIKDDGVSAYSEAYWKDNPTQKVNGVRQAINETLAEMARQIVQPGSKTFDDFGRDKHGRWKAFSRDLLELAKTKEMQQWLTKKEPSEKFNPNSG